ncbi:tripartite tricarboxylate transporter substrate binding protein [Achromobacter sp. GG226]|uniref:Bug family tripartite tricarboxylate transporter substrate binding protein n=1 Tax=Verticiella alkaliphila TaxID=2779529 RepID=UPI001C0B5A14|nr:tripartite tricarboxylate transporter substrate binding protein [Verticiella sp. GG226]MBU4609344.1 tripartite tricarboxylate transporter substrate binding protein [Verticiella sp. GG226]
MSTVNRRHWLQASGALALGAVIGMPAIATAQVNTAQPVRVIVPYPPGAATDALSRLLAQALEKAAGTNFIIENKSGAGSQIGTKAIATAAPDGQTLGFIDTAFAINPGLIGTALPYDTDKDFTPLSLMASAQLVLVVHPSVKVNSMAEFVTLGKAKPGTLNYGSAGVGSAPHLAGEQLRGAAGVDVMHIAYRGGATVITDLLAGQIQFGFFTVPTMYDHIRAGSVRALAVTGDARSPRLPDVPTMAEAGLPAVDATPFFGLIGPAGLSPQTVSQLSQAASEAVRSGPLRERLVEMGFVPVGSTHDEFAQRLQAEIAKWREVIRVGGIKPDA